MMHITKKPTMIATASMPGIDMPAWCFLSLVCMTLSPAAVWSDYSIEPTRLKLGMLNSESQCIQIAKALPTISFSGT